MLRPQRARKGFYEGKVYFSFYFDRLPVGWRIPEKNKTDSKLETISPEAQWSM